MENRTFTDFNYWQSYCGDVVSNTLTLSIVCTWPHHGNRFFSSRWTVTLHVSLATGKIKVFMHMILHVGECDVLGGLLVVRERARINASSSSLLRRAWSGDTLHRPSRPHARIPLVLVSTVFTITFNADWMSFGRGHTSSVCPITRT